MREPFCQFCRHTDGTWDYDEWHAFLLGWFTPYFMWPFIMHHSDKAGELVARETWYVVGGMLLQFCTVLLPALLVIGDMR